MGSTATGYEVSPLTPQGLAALDLDHYERLAHLVDGSPALIVALSPAGVVRFMNGAAERATGFSTAELAGQQWWTLCDLGDQHDRVVTLLRRLQQGDVAGYELPLYSRWGQERRIRWTFRRQLDHDGQLLELLGWGLDLTHEDAPQAQDGPSLPFRSGPQVDAELIIAATYQINAALAPILLGLQLLHRHAQHGRLRESDLASLDPLAEQTLKLSRLLNALLGLLQPPAHARSPQAIPVDLVTLIRQHLEVLTPALQGQPLVVLFPAEPLVVRGEPALLRQLLELLVEDARRASPDQACIEVRVEDNGTQARIVVVDQGPPVPLAQLPEYLLPFAQGPTGPLQTPPRLGVGRFIAQHIVARHGGTLEVRTTECNEHSLIVTLPRAKLPSPWEALGSHAEQAGTGVH